MDISNCASCPCGQAAGVSSGKRCPLIFRQHRSGETLGLEGEPATRIWFVKRGALLLSRSPTDAGEEPREIRGPGTFVGVEALVTGRYADTARTSEPSTVCSTSIEQFARWLGPETPARMVLRQVLIASQFATRPEGSATQRIARWLLDQRDRPTVPRKVLAALLRMVPETLSRSLKQLQEAGAVVVTRRSVTVTDPDRLEAIASAALP